MPNDPYVSNVDGTTNLPYEWAFLTTHVDRALKIVGGESNEPAIHITVEPWK